MPGKVLESVKRHGLENYLLREQLVVGVSGGADSLALLVVLCELRGEQAAETLHVAHLDHAFRGAEAEADAQFVADVARSFGLAATIERINVPEYAARSGLSDEDAARRVRYAFLARVAASTGGVVAVAHTSDDQAETVLMHLLRGSGIGGLGGMRMLSEVPIQDSGTCTGDETHTRTVKVFRPMLEISRDEVDWYCTSRGLSPRRDSTNEDPRYKRNLIRHRVLPTLEDASPGIRGRLVRLAGLAREDDDVLTELAQKQLETVTRQVEEGRAFEFDRAHFAAMPVGMQRRAVRLALERFAGSLADFELEDVDRIIEVITGKQNAPAAVDLRRGLIVKRLGGKVLLGGRDAVEKHADHAGSASGWPLVERDSIIRLAAGERHELSEGWQVVSALEKGGRGTEGAGEYRAVFDASSQEVQSPVIRGRRRGDFIRPIGLGGRKSLQDLYVDAKIPASLRDRVALLAVSKEPGEVLWVPGRGGRRSALAAVKESTEDVLRIEFKRGS